MIKHPADLFDESQLPPKAASPVEVVSVPRTKRDLDDSYLTVQQPTDLCDQVQMQCGPLMANSSPSGDACGRIAIQVEEPIAPQQTAIVISADCTSEPENELPLAVWTPPRQLAREEDSADGGTDDRCGQEQPAPRTSSSLALDAGLRRVFGGQLERRLRPLVTRQPVVFGRSTDPCTAPHLVLPTMDSALRGEDFPELSRAVDLVKAKGRPMAPRPTKLNGGALPGEEESDSWASDEGLPDAAPSSASSTRTAMHPSPSSVILAEAPVQQQLTPPPSANSVSDDDLPLERLVPRPRRSSRKVAKGRRAPIPSREPQNRAAALENPWFQRLVACGGAPMALRGINIQRPWARLLLQGRKTIETRSYPLKGYAEEDLWVIETRGSSDAVVAELEQVITQRRDGAGAVVKQLSASARESRRRRGGDDHETRIIGIIRFGSCVRYQSMQQWRADEDAHLIPRGSAFDWLGPDEPGAKNVMYGWQVSFARELAEPQPAPAEKGIIGSKAVYRVALFK